ncbi:MAG: multicopper oxidase domain-containing protein, partial [Thermoanaerobaculia bacterium]
MKSKISRRSLLQAAGFGSVATGLAKLPTSAGATLAASDDSQIAKPHQGLGTVGQVSSPAFGPGDFLRTWNFSNLPPTERSRFYRETALDDGSLLREYEIHAVDREIEIAPGIFFPAWTYNGQVPGPTLRATAGDTVRIHFVNQGVHPHTLHFHGWHPPEMDGSLPQHQVAAGDEFTYEFKAEPFGLHLYHCHSLPLKRHIHKGLYGAFLVDPPGGRTPADELIMIMNGFDTNFDGENEIYAVNSVAFFYMENRIRVRVGEPVRIYLVNLTEFDPIN